MAQHFKEAARCPVCLTYLEDPVNLKCGYICCRRCLRALPKEADGEGVQCSNCSKVSQTADIKPNRVLGRLAAKAKAMEPQLASVLQMDPKIRKFHGETSGRPCPCPEGRQFLRGPVTGGPPLAAALTREST